MKWIKRKVQGFITRTVIAQVQIGGHCGLCGSYVEDCLVPKYWPWTVCDKCKEDANE